MALFSWRKTKKKEEGEEMSFLDHLEALRWHIMRSILAILLFAIVLFTYRIEIIGGVFMSPFDKEFITYRILCNNFGQFCNNDIRVQGIEVESPDSLTLEGFMWVPDPNAATPPIEEIIPDSTDIEPILPDTLDPTDGDSSVVDSFPAVDSLPTIDTLPNPDTLSQLPSPPPTSLDMEGWIQQKIRLRVSVEQFLTNGMVNGFSVQTDKGAFVKFQATSPYEQFMKALLYAFFGGLILAFPYVIWEIWRFISPALNRKEQVLVRWNVFWSSLLFFSGVLFGYFIILPFSITFLSSFILFEEAENIWRIGDVVNFVLLLLFGSGFLFQLPVAIYYLSKMGLMTPKWLRQYRKHAVVGLLVIAAIITPPDPASQVAIFFPLVGLYEIGILISARVERRKAKRDAEEKAQDDAWRKKKEDEIRTKLAAERAAAIEAGEVVAEEIPPQEPEASEEVEEEEDDDDDVDLTPPEGIVGRDD